MYYNFQLQISEGKIVLTHNGVNTIIPAELPTHQN